MSRSRAVSKGKVSICNPTSIRARIPFAVASCDKCGASGIGLSRCRRLNPPSWSCFDEVPKRETFHQADLLIDGLRNLSPRKLQKLLVDCRSVKVKRLFLCFAERHNHAWLQKLDHKDIDLGSGKRMLVRGGKLDPK